jgi:hypothetical protein
MGCREIRRFLVILVGGGGRAGICRGGFQTRPSGRWSQGGFKTRPYNMVILALAAQLAFAAGAPSPQLNMPALAPAVRELSTQDSKVFDETIALIQKGDHAVALISLTRLEGSNPRNVAVRAVRAYVLLQVGNLLGALDDARVAEKTGPPSPYRCWMLAQISYLAGNQRLCRREVKHLEGNPEFGAEAEKLGRELRAGKK